MAVHGGLDLIMIEHRDVGFSRRELSGRSLPHSAMWITEVVDDIEAVLRHEHVDSAFIVGSSYGSFLASTFGVRNPDRVAGMVLDSAMQSTEDLALERRLIRELFWDADNTVSSMVRELEESGLDQRSLLDVVRAAYELGGYDLLEPLSAATSAPPRQPHLAYPADFCRPR